MSMSRRRIRAISLKEQREYRRNRSPFSVWRCPLVFLSSRW